MAAVGDRKVERVFFPAPDVGDRVRADKTVAAAAAAIQTSRLLPRAVETQCLEWLDTTDLACLYVAAPHLAALVVRYYATDGGYASVPEALAGGECVVAADTVSLASTADRKANADRRGGAVGGQPASEAARRAKHPRGQHGSHLGRSGPADDSRVPAPTRPVPGSARVRGRVARRTRAPPDAPRI